MLNELQIELDKANEMVYPLYGITVFSKAVKDVKNSNDLEAVNGYFNEAIENFERFEPWKFKNSLHGAMCEINNIIMDGKYSDNDMELYSEMIEEFSKKIEAQLHIIQKCEREFAKELIKRVFKNKVIIVTMFIFVVIMVVA